MLKKFLLPIILLVLAYGFWISPNFKAIAAGVAIFLFGMLSLEQGFQAFTGGGLERLLRRTTSSTGRSVLFGIVSTTIMQSSSLVSVIAISFLSAGLITLAAGIGIIFGANLGTTTGAWLIAGFGLKVNIAAYAMPMLAFGVILIFQSSKSLKGIGYILAGLGFLFLGIHYMKEGFETFKNTINLAEYAIAGYPGVLIFTGIGIFATVVMQSSHATLVLTITALAAGQITYENGLGLAIGANIGTTITAILGAMSANEGGKRLAAAHLVFNVVTGVIAIIFIYQIVAVVDATAGAVGIAPDDYTLKLAVFHTLFNLLGIIVMLPLMGKLVAGLIKFIPEKKPEVDQPKYLTDASAAFPETALEAVRLETQRVYEAALRIIGDGLGMRREEIVSSPDLEEAVAAQPRVHEFDIDAMYEKHIKGIYSAIVAFISGTAFSRQEEHSSGLRWLRNACTRMVEAVKDTHHIQENLIEYVDADSENPKMRELYNRIRVQVGLVIRGLEEMRDSSTEVVDALSLDALKLQVNEEQESINQVIAEMISQRAITPAMGSSLINDSGFAYAISVNLIEAAQSLFVSSDRDLDQAAHDVVLDEDELKQVQAAG
ncbi:MAG: Na/Pi cotransporter family protein [Gammaproteobacteria bacterium]|nr:Na/Pi cotransporter family protein [Gammaproteobacteria bacterium]